MGTIWDQVRSESFSKIKDIEKATGISPYEYSTKEQSSHTDDKFCAYLSRELHVIKKMVYTVSDLCFDLEGEKHVFNRLNRLKDEVDIFDDEIYIRHCEWKDISVPWLKKIIERDLLLIKQTALVQKKLNILEQGLLKTIKGKMKNYLAQDYWNDVNRKVTDIEKSVKELAIVFKERETICNLKPIDLQKTFQKMQEEIRSKI